MTCACKCHVKEEVKEEVTLGLHGVPIQPLFQPAHQLHHPVTKEGFLGAHSTVPQPLVPLGTVLSPIIISSTPPLPHTVTTSCVEPVALTGLPNPGSLGQFDVAAAASMKPMAIPLPLMLLPRLSDPVPPVGGGVLAGLGNSADTSTGGSVPAGGLSAEPGDGANASKGLGESASSGPSAELKGEEGVGKVVKDEIQGPQGAYEGQLVPKEETAKEDGDDDDFKPSKKRFRQPTKKGPVSCGVSCS